MENASNNRNYLIVILDCGLDYASILALEQQIENFPHFQLRVISALPFIARYRDRFIEKDHFTTAIYGRLLIPEICHHFKTAIYADCDMVFNRDIAELADLDLGSHYIAAVSDSKIEFDRLADPWWTDYFEDKLGLGEGQAYVNSGLIVFNIEQWTKLKLSQRCIEKLRKKYIFPDQDVINIICKDKIHYLDQAWNCTCPTKGALQEKAISDAINHHKSLENLVREYDRAYYGDKTVFHYTSAIKPWNYPGMENGEKWWHYCRHTPFYEKILSSFTSRSAFSLTNKKIFILGIPVGQSKQTEFCKRLYIFGVCCFKVLRKENKEYFYFLGLRVLKKKEVSVD